MVHLAGIAIHVDGIVIQRCSLCGAELINSTNEAMPLEPDGSAPDRPTWETGRLVEVETGNPTAWRLLDITGRLPNDCCFYVF